MSTPNSPQDAAVADPGAVEEATTPTPGVEVTNGAPRPTLSARPSPTPRPQPDETDPAAADDAEPADAGDAGPADAGTGEPETWQPAVSAPPPWQRIPASVPAAERDGHTAGVDAAVTTYAVTEPDQQPGAEIGPDSSPLPGLTATPEPAVAEPPAQPTAPVTPVPPVNDGAAAPWSTARPLTRTRPPRQASLQLKRVDPWSVLKLALVLAAVGFFVWLVAVGVLYGVLDGMGVWDRLNGTYSDLVSPDQGSGGALISAGRVFGLAAVVGAINSLLFAVALTVGAFVYNVSADLVGGIELTLSERD